MRLLSFFLIAILLLQTFTEVLSVDNTIDSLTKEEAGGDEVALDKKHHPKKINCSYACSRRCRKASRKKVCTRACKTCCARCNCVPPGTYGNKSACPCYASLRTHGNKLKCP
ncbi:unnamed protein product [Ilex paraguariensis]|uniref:Uncharacterized protein n=1 Tax=Ilex paraguariensis TaxID=185542 RepID=A0ABC8SEW9_9AQUA